MTASDVDQLAAPALLRDYPTSPDVFDEAVTGDRQLRGPWQGLLGAFDGLGVAELQWRRSEAERLLEADGVTYHAHDSSTPRWALDPIPVPMARDEWTRVEAAVSQRAELLDLVLTDLYGPRETLRQGLLPADVVYGHPGFIRACDGITLPGPRQLFSYAADLARDADGSWQVQGDRAQAPSGAGYALQNRVVVSRIFPDLYRDTKVTRLSPFFQQLRSALQDVAPEGVEAPRVVVLTPGAASETAYEHAFLASRLGFPLVVAADLTVRGGRVWLRSLGRLEPVDVIARRVDAAFSDPLELRPDSQLGVPGLIEATRQGTVSVVNTLGSGVLENAGLLPFLPRLCQALLGEPLLLPSVRTWWCGDPASLRYVLDHLPEVVVKPLARGARASRFGWTLSGDQRDEVRRRLLADPAAWVAQESLPGSQVPMVGDHDVQPRRMVLRAFAVAAGDRYEVLPGGLVRVAPAVDTVRISNADGAVSKDVWVLSPDRVQPGEGWQDEAPVTVRAGSSAISPRAAENLFWLGRYAERAESTIRLLRVVHNRYNDFQRGTDPAGAAALRVLFAALTEVTTAFPGFTGPDAGTRLEHPSAELRSLVVDPTRPGTVAYAVRRLLATAIDVRDQLSVDTWLVLGTLDRHFVELERTPELTADAALLSLDRALEALLALAGLASQSLVRDTRWRFMGIGRALERALGLTAAMRTTLADQRPASEEGLVIESLLGAAESIVTYRHRYRARPHVRPVLELLLADRDNPRALAFQLDQLGQDLDRIPASAGGDRPQRLQQELRDLLALADLSVLAEADPDGRRSELDAFLGDVIALLSDLALAVDALHFSHLAPLRPLISARSWAQAPRSAALGLR
ncbi:MAG: hypothetical protein EPO13_00545 [Actinomycetota bacterium]|nr:MAG: hypothetical protein EPO13_00545 [Actinomycetota bacterium]